MSVAILWCIGRSHGRITTNIHATNFCAYQFGSEHFLSWLHSVCLTVDLWTTHECEAHTISIKWRNTQVVDDRLSNIFPFITKCMIILQSIYLCVCVCVFSQNNFERKSIFLLLEMNFMSHQNVFLQDDRQTITSLKTGKITVQYTLIFTFLNVLQFKNVYNF